MSSYTKAKQQYETERPESAEVQTRTDYRCVARGCPNAASCYDHGAQPNGKCFFHFRADVSEWDRITREIRANPAKRNHGIVPTEETVTVKDMKTRLKANRPRGGLPLEKF